MQSYWHFVKKSLFITYNTYHSSYYTQQLIQIFCIYINFKHNNSYGLIFSLRLKFNNDSIIIRSNIHSSRWIERRDWYIPTLWNCQLVVDGMYENKRITSEEDNSAAMLAKDSILTGSQNLSLDIPTGMNRQWCALICTTKLNWLSRQSLENLSSKIS